MSDTCPPGLCAMRANGEQLAEMFERLRRENAALRACVEAAEQAKEDSESYSHQCARFWKQFDAARAELAKLDPTSAD